MAKPTERQIKYLENRGIGPPPTKYACSLMIGFLKNGNNTVGKDEPERIGITKCLQNKWIEKRVRTTNNYSYQGGGFEGTVDYLVARDPSEQSIKDEFGDDWKLGPYQARVSFDSDIGKYRKRQVGLSYLELVE